MQNDLISGSVRVPTIEFRASLSNECKVHGLLRVALALLMEVGMVQVRSFAPSVVQETGHPWLNELMQAEILLSGDGEEVQLSAALYSITKPK